MGYHLGYLGKYYSYTCPAYSYTSLDHVLHLLRHLQHQRHSSIQDPMGSPNDSRHPSVHLPALPARVTSMARTQRSMGRSACCSCPRYSHPSYIAPYNTIQLTAKTVHAHGDENSPFVAKELAEIEETVNFERIHSDVTYWELFKPNMINRTHIGIFTQIWSQLTGMNVMMYYISVGRFFLFWATITEVSFADLRFSTSLRWPTSGLPSCSPRVSNISSTSS
jgi:hypothetical protein